jgi:flagellin
LGTTERGFSDIEFQNLKEEIDRISKSTEFNGIKLLDGTGGKLEFQVGIKNDPILDRLHYDGSGADASLEALGLAVDGVSTKEGAQAALKKLDDALVHINGARANFGALQNRLQSVTNNLDVSDENLSAANSRIRDVDVASETAELTKNNILLQAGVSVLSQANQSPNSALKLLQG